MKKINKLIKIANNLDDSGFLRLADDLDSAISMYLEKVAQSDLKARWASPYNQTKIRTYLEKIDLTSNSFDVKYFKQGNDYYVGYQFEEEFVNQQLQDFVLIYVKADANLSTIDTYYSFSPLEGVAEEITFQQFSDAVGGTESVVDVNAADPSRRNYEREVINIRQDPCADLIFKFKTVKEDDLSAKQEDTFNYEQDNVSENAKMMFIPEDSDVGKVWRWTGLWGEVNLQDVVKEANEIIMKDLDLVTLTSGVADLTSVANHFSSITASMSGAAAALFGLGGILKGLTNFLVAATLDTAEITLGIALAIEKIVKKIQRFPPGGCYVYVESKEQACVLEINPCFSSFPTQVSGKGRVLTTKQVPVRYLNYLTFQDTDENPMIAIGGEDVISCGKTLPFVADEEGFFQQILNQVRQAKKEISDRSAAGRVDNDGDGWTVGDGDCNDSDPSINPRAIDIPNDGIDQDCNGSDGIVPGGGGGGGVTRIVYQDVEAGTDYDLFSYFKRGEPTMKSKKKIYINCNDGTVYDVTLQVYMAAQLTALERVKEADHKTKRSVKLSGTNHIPNTANRTAWNALDRTIEGRLSILTKEPSQATLPSGSLKNGKRLTTCPADEVEALKMVKDLSLETGEVLPSNYHNNQTGHSEDVETVVNDIIGAS